MFIDILTDYTLLGSLINTYKLFDDDGKKKVCWVNQKGWKYLGCADRDSGGLLDFYLSCKEQGVKPILGLRFYITNSLDNINDGEIILYAQNFNGYNNLIKLSSRASTEGFKNGQTNLLVEWLENAQDLLCVLPIGNSPNELRTENGKLITKQLQKYFKGKLFFGLKNRNSALDDCWLKQAKDTPYLFLCESKYLYSDDFRAYKTLRAINNKQNVDNLFESIWIDESLEMAEKQFVSYPHKDHMEKFVSMIDIDIPTPGLKVPTFSIPAPYKDSYDYLVALCREGYKSKIDNFPDKKLVAERMKTELDVIKRCQLSDYFLMVYRICKYCDDNNIPRGISRGSAGGCLISFLLDIARVNALEYGLLFERFLNEDRTKPIVFNGEQYLTDAPDIDLDIGQMQRQQVIDWLRQEYGHVAKIATYTTLSAKACLKDVCRAFGKSEAEAKYAASFVEIIHGKSKSIEDTYKNSPKFKVWADANKRIYDIALKLEDVKKNSSIHAAGIVVSNVEISKKAPITLANCAEEGDFKRDECIAYSLDFSSKAGFVKMDLLGIRTLNVLQDTVALIGENQLPLTGSNTIKYLGLDIHLDDADVWRFISKGKNLKGIFQLETSAASNVLKKIKPSNMEELSLCNAINRPGPLAFLDEVAQVKAGDSEVEYLHPALEPFLNTTYGKLLYQEQVMHIAQKLAGFDAKSSNVLLKALGKKDDKKMASVKESFIKGMVANNFELDVAEQIFAWFVKFADYSFNRSHSISYSIMGYISAYIKYHYPIQFYSSLMNYAQYEQKPIEEIAECISELDSFKIKMLPPSIDKLNNKFLMENGNIRYPVGLIKGLGEALFEKLKTLTESSLFSLESCVEAIMNAGLNSRSIEAIIISGALDKYGVDREHVLFYYWFLSELQPEVLEKFWVFKNGSPFSKRLVFKFLRYHEAIEAKQPKRKKQPALTIGAGGHPEPAPAKVRYKSFFKTETTRVKTLERVRGYLIQVAEFRKHKELARFFWETHIMGFSYYNKFSPNVRTFKELDVLFPEDKAISCGFVKESKFRISKKGNTYAILTIQFDTIKEFMLFSDVAAGAKDLIREGDFVKFKAEMMEDKLKIHSINVINQERQKYEFYTKV